MALFLIRQKSISTIIKTPYKNEPAMEKKKNFIYFILSIVFIVSTIFITYNCSDKKHVYTIAVSQCSDDAWRTKLNDEIKMMDYINDSINKKCK